MPDLCGIETIRGIRKIESSLSFIILTGHGDYDMAMAGIKSEIIDFLQKLVNGEYLDARIQSSK